MFIMQFLMLMRAMAKQMLKDEGINIQWLQHYTEQI
jgi:hypothetical protein